MVPNRASATFDMTSPSRAPPFDQARPCAGKMTLAPSHHGPGPATFPDWTLRHAFVSVRYTTARRRRETPFASRKG